jgi:hypothetical protein
MTGGSVPDSFERLKSALASRYKIERFVQEITTTANLQHSNILPLFDSGEGWTTSTWTC